MIRQIQVIGLTCAILVGITLLVIFPKVTIAIAVVACGVLGTAAIYIIADNMVPR